jgi:Leucine-rich repeat (LRR) protein
MNFKTLEADLKKLNWRAFTFNNDTVLDAAKLADIQGSNRWGTNLSWHLFCDSWWAGRDLSVFKPVAGHVKRISLPCEKGTKVIGLDCLVNLVEMSVSGNVSEVDFTRFSRLRLLSVNEGCVGGNWHLCESLNHLSIDVPIANLKKLRALKNLCSLCVGRGLKSFEGIADLPELTELRVGNCRLASLESLGKLSRLQLLLLNLMPKLTSLKGIEGLSNLETLDVTQCGGLQDISSISKLKNLKELKFGFCPQIKTLSDVKLPGDCKVTFVPGGKVGDGFSPFSPL